MIIICQTAMQKTGVMEQVALWGERGVVILVLLILYKFGPLVWKTVNGMHKEGVTCIKNLTKAVQSLNTNMLVNDLKTEASFADLQKGQGEIKATVIDINKRMRCSEVHADLDKATQDLSEAAAEAVKQKEQAVHSA